jgi:hypothetical protein
MFLWLGRVTSLTLAAPIALAPRPCSICFHLMRFCLAVGTYVHLSTLPFIHYLHHSASLRGEEGRHLHQHRLQG